jgi:hypothetical protein
MSAIARLLEARANYVRLASPQEIQGRRRADVARRFILTRIDAFGQLSRAHEEYQKIQIARQGRRSP